LLVRANFVFVYTLSGRKIARVDSTCVVIIARFEFVNTFSVFARSNSTVVRRSTFRFRDTSNSSNIRRDFTRVFRNTDWDFRDTFTSGWLAFHDGTSVESHSAGLWFSDTTTLDITV